MAVLGGQLYVAAENDTTGVEIWRSSDGLTWTQQNIDGFGNSNNEDGPAMEVYAGTLYLGTLNYDTGTELWRTRDGSKWERANSDGFGSSSNVSANAIAGFGGYLYVATRNGGGCELWRKLEFLFWDGFESGDLSAWSAK